MKWMTTLFSLMFVALPACSDGGGSDSDSATGGGGGAAGAATGTGGNSMGTGGSGGAASGGSSGSGGTNAGGTGGSAGIGGSAGSAGMGTGGSGATSATGNCPASPTPGTLCVDDGTKTLNLVLRDWNANGANLAMNFVVDSNSIASVVVSVSYDKTTSSNETVDCATFLYTDPDDGASYVTVAPLGNSCSLALEQAGTSESDPIKGTFVAEAQTTMQDLLTLRGSFDLTLDGLL